MGEDHAEMSDSREAGTSVPRQRARPCAAPRDMDLLVGASQPADITAAAGTPLGGFWGRTQGCVAWCREFRSLAVSVQCVQKLSTILTRLRSLLASSSYCHA